MARATEHEAVELVFLWRVGGRASIAVLGFWKTEKKPLSGCVVLLWNRRLGKAMTNNMDMDRLGVSGVERQGLKVSRLVIQ